jgi:hypothetical protein
MCSGVGYLVRRLEHGGVLLRGEEGSVSGDEVALCLQYRGLLFAALKQTAHILSAKDNVNNNSSSHKVANSGMSSTMEVKREDYEVDSIPAVVQAYCAQVLAVLAFRIPELMPLILKHGLVVTDEELAAMNDQMRSVMNLLEEQMMSESTDQTHAASIKGEKKGCYSFSDFCICSSLLFCFCDCSVNKICFVFFFFEFFQKDLLSAVGGLPHAGIHRKPDAAASFFLSSFKDESLEETPNATAVKCSGLFGWSSFHRYLERLDTTNTRNVKV